MGSVFSLGALKERPWIASRVGMVAARLVSKRHGRHGRLGRLGRGTAYGSPWEPRGPSSYARNRVLQACVGELDRAGWASSADVRRRWLCRCLGPWRKQRPFRDREACGRSRERAACPWGIVGILAADGTAASSMHGACRETMPVATTVTMAVTMRAETRRAQRRRRSWRCEPWCRQG